MKKQPGKKKKESIKRAVNQNIKRVIVIGPHLPTLLRDPKPRVRKNLVPHENGIQEKGGQGATQVKIDPDVLAAETTRPRITNMKERVEMKEKRTMIGEIGAIIAQEVDHSHLDAEFYFQLTNQ